ncbi:hypothetical protein APC96_14350 [Acinetobacter pittii]|uniref:SagB/ThcOx family dehydrogenase n=1 Tax=Acinetobacter pittii TaxID=48296 RepID=UPI000709D812|nr:SagB/ThcOx family dehydrogenase [Acinetobacter pittii]KRI13697.1 hypothetical protein APC96_14350 [Acinetobacter pittii]
MNYIVDIQPAIQLKNNNGSLVIYDLISKESYEVENIEILPIFATITESVPCPINELKEIILSQYNISKVEVDDILSTFISYGLLAEASTIVHKKAGVQEWVDNGWIDALVLHLSSRNLNYSDDPAYFNGLENESFEPIENSKIKEIDEKNASNYYYLNSDLDDISGEDILHGIIGRRSFQPFYKKEFNQNDIDSILCFSNQYARKRGTKIFESSDRDSVYDSAFSALHTYIVIYKDLLILDQVLSAGCYYYDLNKHALILIREGNYKKEVAKLAIGQKRAAGGLATIIIAADLEKYSTVYKHERSYRNLLINTAQLCQFYLVQATIKGFNTFITPAILDEEMADFLDLSDNIPLYIAAIG